MSEYRKAAHTTYSLHYHFVFIPKYRKPVLRGDVAKRLRELVREICRTNNIEILKGHIRREHVHLLLSVPTPRTTTFSLASEPASRGSVFSRLQSAAEPIAFRRWAFS